MAAHLRNNCAGCVRPDLCDHCIDPLHALEVGKRHPGGQLTVPGSLQPHSDAVHHDSYFLDAGLVQIAPVCCCCSLKSFMHICHHFGSTSRCES